MSLLRARQREGHSSERSEEPCDGFSTFSPELMENVSQGSSFHSELVPSPSARDELIQPIHRVRWAKETHRAVAI